MPGAPWPARFLWGASTSAFQVEGATKSEGRGASIWDEWARQAGRMRDGETGEPAAGHHARMEEDVGLLARLGANAYRFSIAWPRVQPAGRGAANEAGTRPGRAWSHGVGCCCPGPHRRGRFWRQRRWRRRR